MENKMLLGPKDRPGNLKWVILSVQHIFAMFGATILVPMLTGLPISVALFTSGVGTLIYIALTKAKVPVYLGSSFAFIVPIQLIIGFSSENSNPSYYFGSVLTGLFMVGLVYVVIAFVIKLIGTNWIDKLLPPIIIGPMIAIIGFSLASTAVSSSGLVAGGSYKTIITAVVSFITVVIFALKGKGFFKIIPFLMGILAGYVTGLILGLVDFSNIIETIKLPGSWFKIPEFMFLGFKDKTLEVLGSTITIYKLNFTAALGLIPIAFVTACEHIGDHAVLSEITGENYLKDPGLDKTLMGDGVATMFAAMVGGPANTTYGENTSVVGMTKIGSVWVTGLAAIIAILLSFSNIFILLVSSIPSSVMGGISLILYGFIGLNGIKVLIDKKVDFNKTKNMIIASAMLVIGLGGAVIKFGVFQLYGMALAAIVGILLNLLLPDN